MSKTIWVDPQDIYDEVKKFQDAAKLDSEAAQPSEKLGRLFIQLTENIISSRSFCRYPFEEKQEMKSESMYRLMKALRRADLSQGPKKVWSYMTRTVFGSCLNVTKKAYADADKQFQLAHDALAAQGCSESKIEQLLGRKLGEKLNFGIAKANRYIGGFKPEAKRKAEAKQTAQKAEEKEQKSSKKRQIAAKPADIKYQTADGTGKKVPTSIRRRRKSK